ncbi:MAG: D-alanyl-D-alanine carboxypeptidase [Defluviitaleaceae bacterium]|nr:D-alanyl-D-alanine carboxypeptidase [Defluviitaleaceae bacterium]
MRYKTFVILLMTTILLSCKAVFANIPAAEITVDARSAILMEASTGKILVDQNKQERLSIASITKVMTLLLVYEAIDEGRIKWDDIVTVSDYAAGMGGSQIFLEPTERQTVRDLTKSVIIASANDSAVALAEYVSGSEEAFVQLMNKRALSLGMTETSFQNSCGLDADGHYSSAEDVAIMSRELINNFPEVLEVSSIWMDSIVHKTARGEEVFGLNNTNRLIKSYQGAVGLKTGSTGNALFCISAVAERDGMMLIAVILGGPTSEIRFHEAARLFDYGFSNYSVIEGESSGTPKGIINVNKGAQEQVGVSIKTQINCVIPKGKSVELESKLELPEKVDAPVFMGQKVGEIVYFANGSEVGRSDLIIMEDVPKAGLTDNLRMLFSRWF